ncbi:MAG TPA: TlpA disulfide reductase family protein [Bryobacteraceae bacterium]|nr:TlpA disulfide reductase family protein [Bryobacteraceae bacterium]
MERNDERTIDRFLSANPEWQPDMGRGLARLREQRTAGSLRRRRRALTGGIVAAVCVPLIAYPGTRVLAARCVSACVTETSAVRGFLLGGASLTPPSTTWIRPEERKMAPDFTLGDVSGQVVTLSGLRGKVVLLNFWATWCTPCGEEIPWFIKFQESRRERGLAVLGVSVDKDGWASVKPYIEAKRVNYSVMIASDNVAQAFGGLKSIPLTLVIDREGRIAAVHAGLCTNDEYKTDIDAVLSEK